MAARAPGFIDHIGIGVPDLAATKRYYDELMSVLGLREWFESGPGGPLNYGPDGAQGSQLCLLPGGGTRHLFAPRHGASPPRIPRCEQGGRPGSARMARAQESVILDEPREFPQYGEHCFATYWLDPHGFKLEAVCHSPEES
jgi:catechol 2,3-dioxygenase-like lactoylglutathione lyase family enzyme